MASHGVRYITNIHRQHQLHLTMRVDNTADGLTVYSLHVLLTSGRWTSAQLGQVIGTINQVQATASVTFTVSVMRSRGLENLVVTWRYREIVRRKARGRRGLKYTE